MKDTRRKYGDGYLRETAAGTLERYPNLKDVLRKIEGVIG